MLTEEYIVECSDKILALYNKFVDASIIEIAKSIKKYYTFDEINRKANLLVIAGKLKEKITQNVAVLNKMSVDEVKKILSDAGQTTLSFDDAIYMKNGFDIVPFTQSPVLKQILEANILLTDGELTNLTKSTAENVQKQFFSAVDGAEVQVQTGFSDYNTAIKNAIIDVVDSGGGTIVEYPTGHKSALDVAVRRCVLTGVSKTASELQWQRAIDMKAPYVDTSAHAGARPSHEKWQGKRFNLNGDATFPSFTEPLAEFGNKPVKEQLEEYNCRHSWFPVMSADEPYSISKKYLQELNSKQVESNGKKYTYYEAEQRLRYMERTIRKYKRRVQALKEARVEGQTNEELENAITFNNAKIREWQKHIRTFVSDTGIDRRRANEQIYY